MTKPCVVICGGGTGGHVFPGLAVADAMTRMADVDVVFCGSPRGIESRVIPPRGYRLELLPIEPMKGGGVGRAVRGAVVAASATVRAVSLVRKLSPRAIVSVGGYAAGPVALAGSTLGIPLCVLEPNGTVGFANKLLAPLAKRAYVAWDSAARAFKKECVRSFGVPLRAGFSGVSGRSYEAHGTARVLVIGGSQGASALNTRFPDVARRLAEEFSSLEIVHQAGRDRDADVRAAYARVSFDRVTVSAFIEDVAEEMACADIIVSRSGAVTVAEIAAIGRAAILVPFPHAADDHQFANARALADAGGAICIRQEAADDLRLAREIGDLLREDARRVSMAEHARASGRPNAADDVARDVLDLAGIDARKQHKNGANGGEKKNGGASMSSAVEAR